MADECNGTCVFHEKYEQKLLEVHDWAQGVKVKIPIICTKLAENKKEAKQDNMDLRVDMENLKKEFNSGIRKLVYVVLGSVILQVVAGVFMRGGLK